MSKKLLVSFFAFTVFFGANQIGFSQQDTRETFTINIDQINSADFPNINMHVIVKNQRGEVVSGLAPGLFRFRINSMEETGRSTVVPFSMREIPIDYNIIISNSGIMEGEPLDFQRNAILQFVDAMNPRDTLSLYTIGEEAGVIFEELRRDNIDAAVINQIGVTNVQPRLTDSVINVVRRVQRRNAPRRVIILISDGRDINSRFTNEQLSAVLREAEIPVYVLGIRVLGAQSLSNLYDMASITGGTYVFTPQVSGIPANIRRLNSLITQPYIINLRARSLRADNMPHVIEVSLDEFSFAGSGQRTFIAVRVPVPRWVRIIIYISIALLFVAFIVFSIIRMMFKRKRMGITRRRCPECKVRMKDVWDTCPFCRYLPKKKKGQMVG